MYKFKYDPKNAHEIDAKVAKKLVETCKKNDGLYVKVGQAMMTLGPMLPKEYLEPLSTLLDNAMFYKSSTIKEILCQELKIASIDELFEDFSEQPIASASIAQVHTAIWKKTGQKVAVKVQKPPIYRQADLDLFLYKFWLKTLEFSFDIPLLWIHSFVKDRMLSECDFTIEAANSQFCRSGLESIDDVYFNDLKGGVKVPEVFMASKRVLISEWVENSFHITNTKMMEKIGLKPRDVVKRATKLFAWQIFENGHVHCDPHPGNLLVKPCKSSESGFDVVLLDHGLYVHLSEKLKKEYKEFWRAISTRDKIELSRIAKLWGIKDFGLFSEMAQMKHARIVVDDEEKNTPVIEVKERVKEMLEDTKKFPKELIFVGRGLNFIRATNWANGSPIDRISLFCEISNHQKKNERNFTSEIFKWLFSLQWLRNFFIDFFMNRQKIEKEISRGAFKIEDVVTEGDIAVDGRAGGKQPAGAAATA